MIFCSKCGGVVLDSEIIYLTERINGHLATCCCCKKCVDKIKCIDRIHDSAEEKEKRRNE